VNFLMRPGDSDEEETKDETVMPIMQVGSESPTGTSVQLEDENNHES
jgi:hypothetical protein